MSERSFVTEGFSSDASGSDGGPELTPGTRLGRYELLLHLSSGGMANVWIARQIGSHGFERLMALKTMRPDHRDDADFREMFLDEARIAARIRHANVVEVFDLGIEGPVVYLAMTLVEGDALSGLLRRRSWSKAGRLRFGVASRIVADALAGLHAAHELTSDDGGPMEVVHRDISPQNILVGIDGSVRIADFGIAKVLGRLAAETDGGQVKGKIAYASPEQLGRRPLDRRTDIFSMGIVLWESFVGTQLFVGTDLMDTLAKALEGNIPDPRSIVAELPEELARVVMRAVAREPSDRFSTAAEMSDALDAATRRAGITASSKDVAAVVSACCGAEIERRRADLRATSRLVSNEEPEAEPLTRRKESNAPLAGAAPDATLPSAEPARDQAPRHEMTMAGTVQSLTKLLPHAPLGPRGRATTGRSVVPTVLAVAGIAILVGTAGAARIARHQSSALSVTTASVATSAEIAAASAALPSAQVDTGSPPSASAPPAERSALEPPSPSVGAADRSTNAPPRRSVIAPRPRAAPTSNASTGVKTRYPNPYEK